MASSRIRGGQRGGGEALARGHSGTYWGFVFPSAPARFPDAPGAQRGRQQEEMGCVCVCVFMQAVSIAWPTGCSDAPE